MTIVLVIWTSRAEGNMILIKDYVFGVICFCFELLLFDWLKRTSK